MTPLFLLVENVPEFKRGDQKGSGANHRKGTPDADGAFRHFVKKSGFALVDLQSVGIRDVLIVSVKEKNQIRWCLLARLFHFH